PSAGDRASGTYPMTISSEPPPGATRLRVTGDDVEGDPLVHVTVDAAHSVAVEMDVDVRTVLLEYVDDAGRVLASYSESALNQHDVDFRRGIIDPPLVRFSPENVSAQSTVSDGG